MFESTEYVEAVLLGMLRKSHDIPDQLSVITPWRALNFCVGTKTQRLPHICFSLLSLFLADPVTVDRNHTGFCKAVGHLRFTVIALYIRGNFSQREGQVQQSLRVLRQRSERELVQII
jgi:hypothetical protein